VMIRGGDTLKFSILQDRRGVRFSETARLLLSGRSK